MIEEGKFVRLVVKEDHRDFYSPHHTNLTYFGLIIDMDERHILMKCFFADLEGNIMWGSVNRFMVQSVESIEELTEDDL